MLSRISLKEGELRAVGRTRVVQGMGRKQEEMEMGLKQVAMELAG
jgi:hypothetical protein